MSPSRSEAERREKAHQVMVEPGEGAELLLYLVRADASAFRSCSAPPRRSGSANWANKADIRLVVHRDPNRDPTPTGRYFEIPTARWANQRPMPTTSLIV
jgi:hypothetical protein